MQPPRTANENLNKSAAVQPLTGLTETVGILVPRVVPGVILLPALRALPGKVDITLLHVQALGDSNTSLQAVAGNFDLNVQYLYFGLDSYYQRKPVRLHYQ